MSLAPDPGKAKRNGEGLSLVTDAIVYVPPNLPDDLNHAERAWSYAERRGLFVASVFRRPGDVMRVLASGIASVVVFSRRAHWNLSFEGVPAEFADEETQRLPHPLPRLDQRARERNGTVSWSAARVHEVIFGDGPLPRGLDPETIAAARRIARHMNGR